MGGCSGCGDKSADIVTTIHQALSFLVESHRGVASFYESLAAHAKAGDRELYLEEAKKHRRMAEECTTGVVPEPGDIDNATDTPLEPPAQPRG